MPNTSKGLPYPSSTDTPDVPRDIQALAVAVDVRLPKAQAVGANPVAVSAAVTATAAVTFPAGRFTTAPLVNVSTSGTSFWCAFSSGVTTTGFTATVRHIDATSTTATPTVNWTATEF